MAIYHLSIKIVTRGKGKSAVAAAAYRAADMIYSEYDGTVHDYTRKRGVIYKEIILSENAPVEYKDRAVLWNSVEMSERYKTAQLAREIEVAIPIELTQLEGKSLVRRFVKEQFVSAGMCADICIHDDGGDNPHAHILLTMRPLEKDGKWGQKSKSVDGRKVPTVDWNDRSKAEQWRKAWADICNKTLSLTGHSDVTIDHRSYRRHGIDQIPTVHLGVAAMQMERRGIDTELGGKNRKIADINSEIRYVNARLTRLGKWLADEKAKPETPSLIDVLDELYNRQGVSGFTRLHNMVDVGNFLIRNKIGDVEGLDSKVGEMKAELGTVRTELKKTDRRIETLKTHLLQCGNYKLYRKYNQHYEKLCADCDEAELATGFGAKRKAEKALKAVNDYSSKHRNELQLFNEADNYLRNVLQSRFAPGKLPVRKWERELAEKLEKRDVLSRKVKSLKDETRDAEQIKRSIERILGGTSETAPSEKIKTQSSVTQNRKPSIKETLNRASQMLEQEQKNVSEQTPRKLHEIDL